MTELSETGGQIVRIYGPIKLMMHWNYNQVTYDSHLSVYLHKILKHTMIGSIKPNYLQKVHFNDLGSKIHHVLFWRNSLNAKHNCAFSGMHKKKRNCSSIPFEWDVMYDINIDYYYINTQQDANWLLHWSDHKWLSHSESVWWPTVEWIWFGFSNVYLN